ncbi:MAG: hypothetical protein KGZ50_06355 [Peptococcaceae bacterium]|nr:hypothetical protein [Peptococcaceae bacterium]
MANYPNYAHHQALHAEFMQNVAELGKQFNANGPTLPFVIMLTLPMPKGRGFLGD